MVYIRMFECVCECVSVCEYCSGVSWDRPIFNGTVCW